MPSKHITWPPVFCGKTVCSAFRTKRFIRVMWLHSNGNYATILHARQNKMADTPESQCKFDQKCKKWSYGTFKNTINFYGQGTWSQKVAIFYLNLKLSRQLIYIFWFITTRVPLSNKCTKATYQNFNTFPKSCTIWAR